MRASSFPVQFSQTLATSRAARADTVENIKMLIPLIRKALPTHPFCLSDPRGFWEDGKRKISSSIHMHAAVNSLYIIFVAQLRALLFNFVRYVGERAETTEDVLSSM